MWEGVGCGEGGWEGEVGRGWEGGVGRGGGKGGLGKA